MPALDVIDPSAVSPSKKARIDQRASEVKPVLKFAKLSENATTPTRGSTKAAGYDLYRLVRFQNSLGIYFLTYCLISTSRPATLN